MIVRLDSDYIGEIYEPGKGDLRIVWERRWGHVLVVSGQSEIITELGDSISEAVKTVRQIVEADDDLIFLTEGLSLNFYQQAFRQLRGYIKSEFDMAV